MASSLRSATIRVADLARQVASRSSNILLLQLPSDIGRGIFAAADIPYGSIIHTEAPMLATPVAFDTTCSSCLRPLSLNSTTSTNTSTNTNTDTGTTAHHFCSIECKEDAENQWLRIEKTCDFSELRTWCREKAEKFPLMAARLACQELQMKEERNYYQDEDADGDIDVDDGVGNVENVVYRGNPVRDVSALCFANVPHPPPEWAHAHALLLKGLRSAPHRLVTSPFDIGWYTWVLSRLHLNAFRVDTVPSLFDLSSHSHSTGRSSAAALMKAASASIQSTPNNENKQGSAVYLLGSMFNHSCEPNVNVVFSNNDAVVSFAAGCDIPKHTELCISYIDQTMPRMFRREHLRFGYGFMCECIKCQSEEE